MSESKRLMILIFSREGLGMMDVRGSGMVGLDLGVSLLIASHHPLILDGREDRRRGVEAAIRESR
jgi:hypothetical protein